MKSYKSNRGFPLFLSNLNQQGLMVSALSGSPVSPPPSSSAADSGSPAAPVRAETGAELLHRLPRVFRNPKSTWNSADSSRTAALIVHLNKSDARFGAARTRRALRAGGARELQPLHASCSLAFMENIYSVFRRWSKELAHDYLFKWHRDFLLNTQGLD